MRNYFCENNQGAPPCVSASFCLPAIKLVGFIRGLKEGEIACGGGWCMCDVAGVAEITEYFWISLIYFFDVFCKDT